MFLSKKVLYLLLATFSLNLVAMNRQTQSLTLLLPINHIIDPHITLRIKIPSTFHADVPLPELMRQSMNEFVPNNEDVNHWTEIITTNLYVGMGASAQGVAGMIKNGVCTVGRNARIIEEVQQDFNGYSLSKFTIAYDTAGRHKIIFGQYYSGPYDCSGFQYTIALGAHMTEQEALRKINDYVEHNVSLLTTSLS